ncbi:lipase-like domain-containing protein, partial [Staphylococcus saprophyticus]
PPTTTTSQQQPTTQTKHQTNKPPNQPQYKNQHPIILLHPFNPFTHHINPTILSHYSRADKLNIPQHFEQNPYNPYQPSITA